MSARLVRSLSALVLGIGLGMVGTWAIAAAPVTKYQAVNAPTAYKATNASWKSTRELACDDAWLYRSSGSDPYGPVKVVGNQCQTQIGTLVSTLNIVNRCYDGSAPDTSKPTAQQCPDSAPQDPNCPAGMEVFATAIGETTGNVIYMCAPRGDGAPIPSVPDSQCTYKNPTTGKCENACMNGYEYKQVPTGAMACVKSLPDAPNQPDSPPDCPTGYMNISATSAPNCTLIPSNKPGMPTKPPGSEKPTVPPTPATSETTTKPPVTTNNPDGSTTTTNESSVKNRDGSTTTTVTTKVCQSNGTCTETSTSTTGNKDDGTPGYSDGSKNDQTDLCMRHPELNVCKNSVVTQADCAATVCTGDAIQCAILRRSIQQGCDARKAEDAVKAGSDYSLGAKILGGTDPLAAAFPRDLAEEIEIGTTLNQSGWMGGGACLPNKNVNIGPASFVIPFENVCPYLLPMRSFLMLLTAYACFQIVRGGLFKG